MIEHSSSSGFNFFIPTSVVAPVCDGNIRGAIDAFWRESSLLNSTYSLLHSKRGADIAANGISTALSAYSSIKKEKLKTIESTFVMALQEENDEIEDELFDRASEDLDKVITTRDEDILPSLIDLFMISNLDYTGVCESLENGIFQYFSMPQILSVLKEKLEKLIMFNIDRAKHFAGACINEGYFEEFRDIFNNIISIDQKKILFNECNKWIGKDYPKEMAILRKDLEGKKGNQL